MSDHCPHCGCELAATGRSVPAHRRLFGAIGKAFHHWPEAIEFVPRDPEHLRAYILVKIGHIDIAGIPAPEGCSKNPALMALFRLAVEGTAQALAGKAGYYEIRVSAAGVEIITPRSIDFRTVTRKQFGPIQDAVDAFIELTIGVKIDRLLRERAA